MFSKLLCASVVAVAFAQEMPGALQLVCDGADIFFARSDVHCTDIAATHHSQTMAGTSPFGSVVLNSDACGPLCAIEPAGTGIETRDGSVVFLAPNEGAFVREATYISSDTELSGMNDARALPLFIPFFRARLFYRRRRRHFSSLAKGI
jgi:hypothetical protein